MNGSLLIRKFKPFSLVFTLIFWIGGQTIVAQSNFKTETQQWLHYFNQTQLSSKWWWNSDAGFRWKAGFETKSQYFIRSEIGYALNAKLQVGAGFAHLGNFDSEMLNKVEFRPHQEVTLKLERPKLTITQRVRLEERFFNSVLDGTIQPSSTFQFRFRYAVTAKIPLFHLSKKNPDLQLLLQLGDELFLHSGHHLGSTIFDQNRIIFGPAIQLSKSWTIALLYNGLLAATSEKNRFVFSQIVWLQIQHKASMH